MTISELLSLCFAAIATENVVLVRLFGVDALAKDGKGAALSAGVMIPVMALSSAVGSILYTNLLLPMGVEYLQIIVFALIAALFAKGAELFYTAVTKKAADFLPLVTLNCSLLGVMLLNAQKGYTVTESTLYGTAAAVGFAIALLIHKAVEGRLRIASPNASFAGAPLTLIAVGLVLMAFSGFAEVELAEALSLPFKGA